MSLGKIAFEAAAIKTGCQQSFDDSNKEKWEAAAKAVLQQVISAALTRIDSTIIVDGELGEDFKKAIYDRVKDIGNESYVFNSGE